MPDIVLNDESVNRYGFRVLTSGIDLGAFFKNPVLLYNHRRSGEWSDETRLPLGKWNNVRKDGSRLLGEPELDAQDETAQALAAKLQSGYVNAASIGIKVIAWSEDPVLMLPGQTQPTVTKCELQEVSLVDIPANPNCVRLSYDGNTIELGANTNPDLQAIFHKKTIRKMNNEALKALGLPEGAAPEQVAAAIVALKEQANQAAQLLTDQKEQAARALIDGAKQAGKITAAQEAHFLKFAISDYDAAKAALDSMATYLPLSSQLLLQQTRQLPSAEGDKPEPVRKYDEMATAGTLLAYSRQNPREFAELQVAKVQHDRELLLKKGLLKTI